MDGSTKCAGAVPIADAIWATTNMFGIGNLGAATEANNNVTNQGSDVGLAPAALADDAPISCMVKETIKNQLPTVKGRLEEG